jgi:hypothetical protein
MKLARLLRPWTSLVIIGVSLFTISSSAQILRFALSDATADAANAAETLGPFAADPMLGGLAKQRLFELTRTDGNSRVEDIAGLLAAAPMSSRAWLVLAAAKLASAAPKTAVINAYVMANLTGPNEGVLMAERVIFALPLWRIFPPPARSALLHDLIGGWQWISREQRTALRAALSIAANETRAEIRGALLSAGRAGAAIAPALGVSAAREP